LDCIHKKPVQLNANLVAQLDCLCSFKLAIENKYVCPELDESFELDIEWKTPYRKQLAVGMPYIANDVFLDRETQQLIMIAGPNMSGSPLFYVK
jgi:DNA mismatch repair protein MutS